MAHLRKWEANVKYSLVRNLEYFASWTSVGVTVNTTLEANFQCCMLARSATQPGGCTYWGDIQHSRAEKTGQDAPGILHSALCSSVSNTGKLVIIQRGEKNCCLMVVISRPQFHWSQWQAPTYLWGSGPQSYVEGFAYEERLKGLNMNSSAKLWLKGDVITAYKYLKGINIKKGNELFRLVQGI